MKKVKDLCEFNEDDLKHSFYDACSDMEFKKYVDTLDIKEEILIKYTTTLQDSFLEYKNCLNCKDLDTCQNKIKGYCYKAYYDNGVIGFCYDQCLKLKEVAKKNAYKENLNLFDMPKNIKEFDDDIEQYTKMQISKIFIKMIKCEFQ